MEQYSIRTKNKISIEVYASGNLAVANIENTKIKMQTKYVYCPKGKTVKATFYR